MVYRNSHQILQAAFFFFGKKNPTKFTAQNLSCQNLWRHWPIFFVPSVFLMGLEKKPNNFPGNFKKTHRIFLAQNLSSANFVSLKIPPGKHPCIVLFPLLFVEWGIIFLNDKKLRDAFSLFRKIEYLKAWGYKNHPNPLCKNGLQTPTFEANNFTIQTEPWG